MKKIKKIIKIYYTSSKDDKHERNKFGKNNSDVDIKSLFLHALSEPAQFKPQRENGKLSWLRSNFLTLLVGFIPTLLGGFASMFVFLSGGITLINEFGLAWLALLLKNPLARFIELSLALALTFYYGFSHVYNNRKSFLRHQELKHTQGIIIKKEEKVIHLNAQVNFLRKIIYLLRHLILINTLLIHTSNYLKGDKLKL
jgi:hypothetical protein